MENSKLFYEFMTSNEFHPSNYENILELNQSVNESLSKYLKNFNQFLLSDEVKYSDLTKYDVKGAKGYIDIGEGIVVPKSLEADDYFLNSYIKSLYEKHGYNYPKINEIDSIISYNNLIDNDHVNVDDLRYTLYHQYPIKDYYVGFIADKYDEKLKLKLAIYEMFMDAINVITNQEYKITHDSISSVNKEFYLVRKK